ncbi:MAG TPA: superoxide dismutase [Phenylobacterium sp.]
MIPLPDLPYDYDALEPVLSDAAMRLHHDKHNGRYVDVVNAMTAGEGHHPTPLEELIRHAALAGERKLFNNAAQAWNHAFFWRCMTPHHAPPRGPLVHAIDAQFGDLATLRNTFIAAGTAHFGSGWVWLTAEEDRLSVFSTHDADTVVTRDLRPLLVCDLWEHAYYLDHLNDRAGFLSAWWDRLANWAFAQEQFVAERGAGWRHPAPLDPRVARIEDEPGFARALHEARGFLDAPPAPDSFLHLRFRHLVGRIADYCDGAPPGGPARVIPADFDVRLNEAVRRAAEPRAHDDRHGSPMVDGDLRRSPSADT